MEAEHGDGGASVVVLVVGGSGYLGLHLLQAFARLSPASRLAFTYFSHPPPPALLAALPSVRPYRVDLRSGQGFHDIAADLGPPSVVINCAAISVPRECETDPSTAMAVNIPTALVDWLSSFSDKHPPLLVHLSTDQVYEGKKSFYKEDDEAKPVNIYGKSKLEAEKFIMNKWSHYAILRSSIIYGPQPILHVQKTLPIQWIDSVLSNGKGAEFFDDEYRCPVFVRDLVKVVELVIAKARGEAKLQLLVNVGGPERLSRADMAEVVAAVKGYDKALVRHVSAASVNRGVASPADISMDVSRLTSLLHLALTPFHTGVELTLARTS